MSTKLVFLSLQNSKCKYSPMPSEFQFKEPPLALGIPVQRIPPCPRNSKKPSIVVYGYFLELPIPLELILLNQWSMKFVTTLLLMCACKLSLNWLGDENVRGYNLKIQYKYQTDID